MVKNPLIVRLDMLRAPRIVFLLSIAITLSYRGNAQGFSYSRDFPELQRRSLDKTDRLYYPTLLSRFQANDTTLADSEVLALLIGYTKDAHYLPYEDTDISGRIFRLNATKEFHSALALADSFLASNPVDQGALIEKAYALHKLGKDTDANRFLFQFRAIMKAMKYSGDGRSAEGAIFALGPVDGQNFILKGLGAQLGSMGSGYDKDHHFLDILEAISKDGEDTTTYFFNIDHATLEFREQLKQIRK